MRPLQYSPSVKFMLTVWPVLVSRAAIFGMTVLTTATTEETKKKNVKKKVDARGNKSFSADKFVNTRPNPVKQIRGLHGCNTVSHRRGPAGTGLKCAGPFSPAMMYYAGRAFPPNESMHHSSRGPPS